MSEPDTINRTRRAREAVIEIARACRVHEQDLELYGRLGDAVRAAADPDTAERTRGRTGP